MKTFNDELEEWYEIFEYVRDMYDRLRSNSSKINDDIYKILYDRVFSDKINGRLQEIYPFDWCDPDMDYSDDFCAWYWELESKAEEVKILLGKDED